MLLLFFIYLFLNTRGMSCPTSYKWLYFPPPPPAVSVRVRARSHDQMYISLILILLLLLLLLQSVLQPLWVMASSTIVEYSQQEGFYRVPLPAARQTPNLEDQWLESSNSRHKVFPASETTRANYGREMANNFAVSGDFHFTFGFFYMP